MTKKKLFSILSASTLILFALSALITVPALAAGGAPPAPTSPTTQTNLKKVPKGTAVDVVDQNGNLQPLASQAAAKIIAKGDPIWCPKGVKPKPGLGGCTTSYSNLSGLVGALGSVTPANGVIWISAGPDTSASNITINGGVLTTLASDSLTLQGGWTGTAAGKVSGTSNFSKSITVEDWNNDVTVNDIIITGASGNGLTVTTKGNIHVHEVQSNNNSAYGADLNNTSGTGSISVDTSTFNGNTTAEGLFAVSNGVITLTAVTASSNGDGVYLANDYTGATGEISITSSSFTGNSLGIGLNALSNGAITLTTVTDSSNRSGAFLSNNGIGDTAGISITSSAFNSNTGGYGLDALSNGAITLNKVTANANSNFGAELENNYSGDTGAISLTSSTFESNTAGYGLEAGSNGAITLNKVTASFNGDGAELVNNGLGDTAGITLTSSTFDSNTAGIGLTADSNGALTLNKVIANANHTLGASLNTSGTLTITSSTFNGNTAGYGLVADATSALTLNKVTANANADGAELDTGGALTITSSTFDSNTAGFGLAASSTGALTLNQVNANANHTFGASMATSGALTITSSNFNNSSAGGGLSASSTGALTLNKVTANANHTYGASLDTSGPLTITSSTFNNSSAGGGLIASSTGALTLNKVMANANHTYGASLDTSGPLTITSSTFNNTSGELVYLPTPPAPSRSTR